jgi:hypothetical protein
MNETIKKRSNVRSRNPEKRKENNGLSAETSRLRVRQFETKYEYGVKGKGKGKKKKSQYLIPFYSQCTSVGVPSRDAACWCMVTGTVK